MKTFYQTRVLVPLLLLLLFHTVKSQSIVMAVEDWPPYSSINDTATTGIVIDIIDEIAMRLDIDLKYKYIPHKRILQLFLDTIVTAEATSNPLWRSEEHQRVSCYTIPYIIGSNVVLIKKSNITHPIVTLDDFNGMTIGCNSGYGYTDGFEQKFKSGEIIREDTPSGTKSNITKLSLGRVDAIIDDPLVIRYVIKELGLSYDDYEEVYTLQQDNSIYIRLHTIHEQLLPSLNSVIEEMQSEGVINAIIDKYCDSITTE